MESVARVSDYADIRGIQIIDTPPDGGFVIIFALPDDIPGLDIAHDVVVYEESGEKTPYGWMDRESASEHAVEKARERGMPLMGKIYDYDASYRDMTLSEIEW